MVVGRLPPPDSSRWAAPVPRQLGLSLLPPLCSVYLLLFRSQGHHTTTGVAVAASNKLQQDEFTIFVWRDPEEKRRDG